MVITDNGGVIADGRAQMMPNYVQVARCLQDRLRDLTEGTGEAPGLRRVLEIAAKELGISRDDHANSRGSARRRLKKRVAAQRQSTTTCGHCCALHKGLMSPALWGTLPNELLPLIFARLPLPAINRLRCVSTYWDWKESMAATRDPNKSSRALHPGDFFRVCEQLSPKMLALVTRDERNLFWVRVFDTKSNRWHAFKIGAGRSGLDTIAVSADGGLVCFVSASNFHMQMVRRMPSLHSKSRKPRPTLFVTIMNPLTQSSDDLPPLLGFYDVIMVQIVIMDHGTKRYKVFVVGNRAAYDAGAYDIGAYDVGAAGYDSETRQWTTAEESLDLILGYRSQVTYHNSSIFGLQVGLCAYDFAEGQLLNMDSGVCRQGEFVKSHALQKDRLYVLRCDANESPAKQYYIVEYHAQMRATIKWVEVTTHRCSPFECPPKAPYTLKLYACDGFLMVLAALREVGPYQNELGWLYDLSTDKWHDLHPPKLPEMPGKVRTFQHLLCDLHWNV